MTQARRRKASWRHWHRRKDYDVDGAVTLDLKPMPQRQDARFGTGRFLKHQQAANGGV